MSSIINREMVVPPPEYSNFKEGANMERTGDLVGICRVLTHLKPLVVMLG